VKASRVEDANSNGPTCTHPKDLTLALCCSQDTTPKLFQRLPHVVHSADQQDSTAAAMTTDVASPVQNTAFLFLDLPSELRLLVYEALFHTHHRVLYCTQQGIYYIRTPRNTYSPARKQAGLLTTCKQIRSEAIPVFFAATNICLTAFCTINLRRDYRRLDYCVEAILLARLREVVIVLYTAASDAHLRIIGRVKKMSQPQCLDIEINSRIVGAKKDGRSSSVP